MASRTAVAASAGGGLDVEQELESHRRALTGYCYRMLGSGSEAEDAVQETLVRAWRARDGFEGRSSVRSWLYRIATNVCVDMVRTPQRRARPMDFGAPVPADTPLAPALPEHAWVQPVADARVLPTGADPAELAVARESVRLAFVAALQHLPPRQRAVLILREVLRWQASEVAELLGTSVAAVNSALQRARATMATCDVDAVDPALGDPDREALLARYVDAFERYDVGSLVALLRDDVEFSMPPFALWLRGPEQVAAWLLGQGSECRGSRLVATAANGSAAFACYHPAGPGRYEPFALQVVELSGGRIAGIHNFLDPSLFAAFGLPPRLED